MEETTLTSGQPGAKFHLRLVDAPDAGMDLHADALQLSAAVATDRPSQRRNRLRLGSGREPFVSMMKAADLRESDNPARTRWAGRTRFLGER